jgi:hypothetical protein
MSVRAFVVILACVLLCAPAVSAARVHAHSGENSADLQVATAYMRESLVSQPVDVVFSHSMVSKTGTHFHFQQVADNGLKVRGCAFTVSVDQEGEVFHDHDGTWKHVGVFSVDTDVAVSEDGAHEKVWAHVRPTTELESVPTMELVYDPLNVGHAAFPVYRSEIHMAGDNVHGGAWAVCVDPTSGEIVSTVSRAHGRGEHKKEIPDFTLKSGAVLDREQAVEAARAKEAAHADAHAETKMAGEEMVDGSGRIFLADPITATGDESLNIATVHSELPGSAYAIEPMRNITKRGGKYYLKGPYVFIDDWSEPFQGAQNYSSADGWDTCKLRQDCFYEAMAYYHIDHNYRYLTRLGYASVFDSSFSIDPNGLDGSDNSAFYPGRNSIAMGTGGVPDSEDAGVLIHEYGHAIQHNLNPSWSGGDTGAMGEGFGDYWAGSHRHRLDSNAALTLPDKVFVWDGVAWGGRFMNHTDEYFNPTQSYGAHVGMGDQTWSSPLWVAAQTLVRQFGESRDVPDTVVMESHYFTASGGQTMAMQARWTLDAAYALYKQSLGNSFATEVFFSFFSRMNMVFFEDYPDDANKWDGSSDFELGDLSGADKVLVVTPSGSNTGANVGAQVVLTLSGNTDGTCEMMVAWDTVPTTGGPVKLGAGEPADSMGLAEGWMRLNATSVELNTTASDMSFYMYIFINGTSCTDTTTKLSMDYKEVGLNSIAVGDSISLKDSDIDAYFQIDTASWDDEYPVTVVKTAGGSGDLDLLILNRMTPDGRGALYMSAKTGNKEMIPIDYSTALSNNLFLYTNEFSAVDTDGLTLDISRPSAYDWYGDDLISTWRTYDLGAHPTDHALVWSFYVGELGSVNVTLSSSTTGDPDLYVCNPFRRYDNEGRKVVVTGDNWINQCVVLAFSESVAAESAWFNLTRTGFYDVVVVAYEGYRGAELLVKHYDSKGAVAGGSDYTCAKKWLVVPDSTPKANMTDLAEELSKEYDMDANQFVFEKMGEWYELVDTLDVDISGVFQYCVARDAYQSMHTSALNIPNSVFKAVGVFGATWRPASDFDEEINFGDQQYCKVTSTANNETCPNFQDDGSNGSRAVGGVVSVIALLFACIATLLFM